MKFTAKYVDLFKSIQANLTDEYVGKELEVSIKIYKPTRSLNQNSLIHSIFQEISIAMNLPIEEVKHKMVIDHAQSFIFVIRVDDNFEKNLNTIKYHKVLRQKVRGGVDTAEVEVFRRTSEMDTKEMSQFIDRLMEDCKSFGIYDKVKYYSEQMKNLLKEN